MAPGNAVWHLYSTDTALCNVLNSEGLFIHACLNKYLIDYMIIIIDKSVINKATI